MPRTRTKILRPHLDPARAAAPPSANPRCRCCGRPDGTVVRCLPDGRWYDAADQTWRDCRGRRAAWPDVVEYATTQDLAVSVRPVRASDAPEGRPRLLCNRCQMIEEAVRARIRARMRRAIGDLFLGAYGEPATFERFLSLRRRSR
ncbi:MAG TPA: hypothetical protein VD978_19695 [Azospirillum sp.]|nr:hypothetical protein [Azospirillum sp.]